MCACVPVRRYRLITEAEHQLLRSAPERSDYHRQVDGMHAGGSGRSSADGLPGGKGSAATDAERNTDPAMQVTHWTMPRSPHRTCWP